MIPSERRARLVEGTGIDEAMIERLVCAFYEKVRNDALLGPIFHKKIISWELHLDRMCAFWSSVVLTTGRYHGQPMEKHLALQIESEHFDRWLELSEETALEVCPSNAATHFIDRAKRIAESLQVGIGFRGRSSHMS